MASKIALDLSTKKFEELHVLAQGRSKQVIVDRAALAELLRDHGKLLAHLRAEG